VSLPASIIQHIHQHYQATGWVVITLNPDNTVKHLNQTAADLLSMPAGSDIRDELPLLATESLEEPFYLPFYHHEAHVYDVHFVLDEADKFLIWVPVDVIHQQVQAKQQMAHDEEIEKMRFKSLFETLETAHQELQEANSAKSFYISALSHEMGNPLNAIKGYNSLLAEGAVDTAEATRIIDNNVDKLTTIIRQTLDYDNQNKNRQLQTFAPAKTLDHLCQDFALQARQKNLRLINHTDPELRIRCQLSKWTQIMTNLISNAIKYTDEGSVTIHTRVNEQGIHFEVKDTGCGISEGFRKQLFKPWSREYRSEASGNGIGLVISGMLAEQLGASLVLQHSDDSGSTFCLSLPPTALLAAKRVLLVDDDEDCLLLFQHYLAEQQHQVTTAHSLQELLHIISSGHHFDVLISDLNLGDQPVTQALPDVMSVADRCLVMTANPTNQLREELSQLGFTDVLSKPLSQQDLVNSVA
jgi:signal transduction histidine kinase/BarA-like signal transduction histidine kinase